MALDIIDRIKKLGTYFNNMNIDDGIIYVRVCFPKGWGCSEVTEYNFNVKCVEDEVPGYFYFFTNTEEGFEKIFDAIDYNIKFNQDAQDKVNLLRTKVEELKNIFEEEDISVLRTLEFKFKKKKEKNKKTNKKTETEPTLQNTIVEETKDIDTVKNNED